MAGDLEGRHNVSGLRDGSDVRDSQKKPENGFFFLSSNTEFGVDDAVDTHIRGMCGTKRRLVASFSRCPAVPMNPLNVSMLR